MALRQSKGLRNYKLQHGSFKHALQNGEIRVFSGNQPASADDAEAGTLLYVLTKGGLARTAEVLSLGTVTLTGGASGSVDTVTVNGVNIIPHGAVPFNTSLTQTAADLAAAINLGLSTPEYRATSSGAVVTISALRGTGTGPNGFVVTGTLTTITATYGNMASGVAAVNGLSLGVSAAGVLVKNPSEVWQGSGLAAAGAGTTAGWFRVVGSVADNGTLDSTESQIRLDGAIATSGAEGSFSSTTIVFGAVQTANSFQITDPAS